MEEARCPAPFVRRFFRTEPFKSCQRYVETIFGVLQEQAGHMDTHDGSEHQLGLAEQLKGAVPALNELETEREGFRHHGCRCDLVSQPSDENRTMGQLAPLGPELSTPCLMPPVLR